MSSRVLQKGINRITQGYKATIHKGVDLGREHITGEPIIAHSAGTVVSCVTGQKNNKGSTGTASYGNYVKIDHGDGYETLYAHLASVKVKKGQFVKRGEVIGTMGNTGNSYGTHLHFEVRKNGSRIDPTKYLDEDLPITDRIDVEYRVYVDGRWLPKVTNCGDGADGYAGIFGKEVSALQIFCDCATVRYRAHLVGGGWLSWVTSGKSWAGIRGKQIDAIQMELVGAEDYKIRYRVTSLKTPDWHGWCEGLTDETGDGYAGVMGYPIDGVQIEFVRR